MNIRESLQADLDATKAKVTELENKMSALESEAGGWMDKEEGEVKSFFLRMASYFSWLQVKDGE